MTDLSLRWRVRFIRKGGEYSVINIIKRGGFLLHRDEVTEWADFIARTSPDRAEVDEIMALDDEADLPCDEMDPQDPCHDCGEDTCVCSD